ncbi:MAG: uroporphyrinogen decarboxylase family protein [SAR202 cluster bacterium]|nr:uroporphyrinogen decarboxylase family protein [SAR202 cluster bacterium]
MAPMTSRERVRAALNHEEPDRVPIDMGTVASTINSTAYKRLVKKLGLTGELERPDLNDPTDPSKNVTPSVEILEMYGVDTRSVQADAPIDSQSMDTVQLNNYSYRDEWGVVWNRAETGPYMNKDGPFQKEGVTVADIERYPWPDPEEPHRTGSLRDRAKDLHENTDYAVVVSVGHSCVAPCQRLRGFAEWMEDLAFKPALAEALLEQVTNVIVGSTIAILRQAGPYADVVAFSDDLGFQDRAYFSKNMFRKQIKPYLARCVEAIRDNTDAKVVMHNDGAIYDLIPDLIDIGVDVINPVQTTAWKMEAGRLKADFGDNLAFWGAIDTQHALPFGTPDDVRDDVKDKIRTLAPGGGYVLTSCHCIQEEVSAENIQAMYESALEFGSYDKLGTL